VETGSWLHLRRRARARSGRTAGQIVDRLLPGDILAASRSASSGMHHGRWSEGTGCRYPRRRIETMADSNPKIAARDTPIASGVARLQSQLLSSAASSAPRRSVLPPRNGRRRSVRGRCRPCRPAGLAVESTTIAEYRSETVRAPLRTQAPWCDQAEGYADRHHRGPRVLEKGEPRAQGLSQES